MSADEMPLETPVAESSTAVADPSLAAMPTAAPKEEPTPSPAVRQPRRLAYLEAIRFAFSCPEWILNFVFLIIVGFLPVLGHVAQWGYYYEIVEALCRNPSAAYPKFEFRRFGDYCMRGVWPYVLSMTVWMILYMIFYLPLQLGLQFGLMILLAGDPQVAMLVGAVVGSVVLVGALFVVVGTAVMITPILLRAGLTQDFRLVFQFDWFKGFWRRMWVEETLVVLFLMAAGIALAPVGCLAFGVGLLVVPVVIWIAGSQLQWQLYEIYLERGGEPIPLHPLPAEVPPVQVQMPGPG